MTLPTIPTPVFEELLQGYLAEYRTRLGDVDTSPGSDIYARAWAAAQLEAHGVTRARYIERQLHPGTARVDHLEQWAADYGVTRLPPSPAAGPALVTGNPGQVISVGDEATDGASRVFAVTAGGTIPGGGTLSVTLQAREPGTAGNLASGSYLTWSVPVAGVEQRLTVTSTFTGGTDAERDEELRDRVIDRIQNPPASGNRAHFVSWVTDVPGVRRGFCYSVKRGLGTVDVAFQGAYTSGRDGRIAPGLAAAVDANVQAECAETDDALTLTPTPEPVDIEIRVSGTAFDWTGSMTVTPLTATSFQVATVPAGLTEHTSRVVWAPTTGADRMQRIAVVDQISGTGPYTITLEGVGFLSDAWTGSQTLYPGGPLTDTVASALLAEGGPLDRLTPGDTTPPTRWPEVSALHPTSLSPAHLIACALSVEGVADVAVVSPASTVSPPTVPVVPEGAVLAAYGTLSPAPSVLTPRRLLVRPL